MKLVKNLKSYIIESYAEMKKVTWPSKKQTKIYSIIVIALSLGIATFFGILDYIFNIMLGWIV